jgi:hypothetical protein
MSIKIGTVDPLELIDPSDASDHLDRKLNVHVNHVARPAVIELRCSPCVLSISDARCLVSLLSLAIRQAELRGTP